MGCDDGNILNNDGCSSDCSIEDGFECVSYGIGSISNCTDSNATPEPTSVPTFSSAPTSGPTSAPTLDPTRKPTINPTRKPTINPTITKEDIAKDNTDRSEDS